MLLQSLILLNIMLAGMIGYLLRRTLRDRAWRHAHLLEFREWPIRRVTAEEFDGIFAQGPLGPALDTQIRFISGYRVLAGISDFETWLICNLAKNANHIFEFGTYSGKTAFLLAANAPNARVTTLTLRPDDVTRIST